MKNKVNSTVTKPDWLPEKYFIFCEEYLRTNNKAEAARRAGYTSKAPGQSGYQLLKNAKVKRYLKERLDALNQTEYKDKVASANEVLEYLTRVMRGEEKTPDGQDTPLYERTKAAQELAKRLVDTEVANNPVNIVIDIPRPECKVETSTEDTLQCS